MSLSLHGKVAHEGVDLAKTIKAVVFDVDGVFTNNTEMLGLAPGVVAKSRSYYDGQGVSLLRAIGVRVALVTNEKGAAAKHIEYQVEKWNKLPSSKTLEKPDGWEHVSLYTGRGGVRKVEVMEEWLASMGLSCADCAAMGDDLVDVPMLKKSILRASPAQAEIAVQELAHFVSRRVGGSGAVRDFANFILESRNLHPFDYPPG